jgi:RHS repeat-associated protein
MTRTVWDGDQVLYEIRFDGGAFADLDQAAVPAAGDSTYGWVGYTHGPGIDAPLDVMRMALDGGQLTLVPHANWRGHYDFMTDTTGAQFGCAPAFYTDCPELYLPRTNRRAFLDVRAWRRSEVWVGNVVHGQQDRSGLMYMRNRYYDPATGRFTQQDPVGLAGGLNLYGFANGDPVNFTDPFGLDPCRTNDYWCLAVRALAQVAGGLGGFAFGFSAGGGAGLSCTIGAVVCSPAMAILGGISGSIVGAQAAGELFDVVNAFSDSEGSDAGSSPQDKRLSPGEIRKLKDAGYDPHDLKPNSDYDLFKDASGNIVVKPKSGRGPGDPTGLNENDLGN